MRAALVASCLRGALPPVDLRAVCLVRAMFAKDAIGGRGCCACEDRLVQVGVLDVAQIPHARRCRWARTSVGRRRRG